MVRCTYYDKGRGLRETRYCSQSVHSKMAQLARTVEDMGFDALWSLENRHEPFMPLAVAASATEKLHLGTSIALAFVGVR